MAITHSWRKSPAFTPEDVDRLGTSTDIPTACRALGISRDLGYDLAKSGQFPIPIIRAGGRYVVPVMGLKRALGLEESA